MTTTQIRKILRAHFGTRRYRTHPNGEIYVYGRMPNTNEDGWYLFDWLNDPETEARIDELG